MLYSYEKSSKEVQLNMPGKRSAADYTQIGHGITDGALQGMDVSQAWKLASESAMNYTPAALQPCVCPLLTQRHRTATWEALCCIQHKCDNSFAALCETNWE